MNQKYYFVINSILLCFSINFLFSQVNDTTSKILPELSIYAEKYYKSNSIKSQYVNIIDLKFNLFYHNKEISEILRSQSGISIKDYGSASGMKTINVRGLSANQSNILINDIKINNSTNNVLDLSNIDINIFDKIIITKNGGSSLGNNSLGGNINFLNSFNDSKKINLKLNYGSFNDIYLNAKILINSINTNSFISFHHNDGDFNYSFIQNDFKIAKRRNNAQFNSLNLFTFSKISDNISLISLFYDNNRGLPEPNLPDYYNQSSAKLEEKNLFLSYFQNISEYILSISMQLNNLVYSNDDNLSKIINSTKAKYFTKNLNFSISKLFNNHSIKLNINHSDINGDMLDLSLNRYIYRDEIIISYNNDFRLLNFNSLKLNLLSSLNLSSYINNNDFNLLYNYSIGYLILFEKIQTEIKSSYSHNNRLPSFNELYYLNYGNSNLLPETSNNFEISISNYTLKEFDLSLVYYYNNVKNMIFSIPRNPISWKAENFGEVINYGIEIILNGSLFNNLNYSVNYTLQNSFDNNTKSLTYKKRIPYIPQELISFDINYKYEFINLGININYNSYKFTLPDNNINSIIPSYYTINLINNYIINEYFNIFINVNNLLNREYEIVKFYPMPGINYKIGINFIY